MLAAQALVLALERQRSPWDLVRVIRDVQLGLALPNLVDDTLACLFTYYGSRPQANPGAPVTPLGSVGLPTTPGVDGFAATPLSVRTASTDSIASVRYSSRVGPPMAEERVSMLFALQHELLQCVGRRGRAVGPDLT